MSLYMALLFVVLTPGVLFTLPKGGSKLTIAAVHGLLFLAVYYFTSEMVWRAVSEDFQGMKAFDAIRRENTVVAERDAAVAAKLAEKARKEAEKAARAAAIKQASADAAAAMAAAKAAVKKARDDAKAAEKAAKEAAKAARAGR